MKFKLKTNVGNHTQGNRVYKAEDGEIIESDIDLVEKFPNKFEKVVIPGAGPSDPEEIQKAAEEGAKEIEPQEEEEEEDDWDDEEEELEPLGADVTKKFPIAVEKDFKVFYKRGKGYMVTEADDPFTKLNKKKLKKANVKEYIEKQLED